ncbi:hypothetical protein FBY31_3150 [Arthrobacter sp. SLBN-100]|nr:hypothetical protein FBY31_3150 [Arthrobacter sp. SLBN-100]
MLDAMERPDLEDNAPDIAVLEGQTSVEELLADLGFEWLPEAAAGADGPGVFTEESFSQPALFQF